MRSPATLVLCAALFLSACGGSSPPAEEPKESSEPAADAPAEKPVEEAPAEPKAEEKADPPKSDASNSSGPTMTRTARDILTAPDTLFMFSFNESDVKGKAEEACEGKSKGDPKKRADCMTKEKAKIDADGVGFKEEKGTWIFSTVKRRGKVLTYIHKVPFEFAKEEPNKVTLKITGKDTGTKPAKFPNEITIEVPNDYQIVMNDPEHGKMVYEAKIGLLSK
jgi:hypothetical protein